MVKIECERRGKVGDPRDLAIKTLLDSTLLKDMVKRDKGHWEEKQGTKNSLGRTKGTKNSLEIGSLGRIKDKSN